MTNATQEAQQVGSRTGLAHRATESPRAEGSLAFLWLLALIGGAFRECRRTQGWLATTPLSPGVSVFPSACDPGYLSPDLKWFLYPLPSPREEPSTGQCSRPASVHGQQPRAAFLFPQLPKPCPHLHSSPAPSQTCTLIHATSLVGQALLPPPPTFLSLAWILPA